jgi:uncharacterized membrane protein YhaH (DUF805 family)
VAAPSRDEEPGHTDSRHQKHGSKWWYLLLFIPLVGLLYPPFYNSFHPDLGGVPFFIWYQFAWVLGGAATTLVVTALTNRAEDDQ